MPAPPNERRPGADRRADRRRGELLDEGGIDALTFRALASRLSTGAGALYHHVANKDELLALATSAMLDDALASPPETPRDVRSLLLEAFDVVTAHPWVGTHLTAAPWQPAVLRLLDRVGSGLVEPGASDEALLDEASALVHHLLGVAGQRGAAGRAVDAAGGRRSFIAAEVGRAVGGAGAPLPFMDRLEAQLVGHDDREQYAAAVEIILAGVDARRAHRATP